jgi:glucosamine--fructose-6-phosphate aminotransferase (isomerizing)
MKFWGMLYKLGQVGPAANLGRGTSARARAQAQGNFLHPPRGLVGGGEFKHGPIALIDETVSVIVTRPMIASSTRPSPTCRKWPPRRTNDCHHQRQGRRGRRRPAGGEPKLPTMPAAVAPLVYAVPAQRMAYRTAGTDVDQPRNLAKSVTVQ